MAEKLKHAATNDTEIAQDLPEPMLQDYVDKVIDALKTEQDNFHHRGGIHMDGELLTDLLLKGKPLYLPGFNDFCKLYCIQCMVSSFSMVFMV